MVNNTRNFCVSGLYPSSGVWRNATFRKLVLFPPSGKKGGGKKTPTQLGPLERSNLNHWTSDLEGAQLSRCLSSPPFYLRTETDPVFETSCSFKHRTMDKVQKRRNSLCYSKSSQPFRNYRHFCLYVNSWSQTMMLKEAVVAEFKVLSQHLFRGIERNHDKLSQDRQRFERVTSRTQFRSVTVWDILLYPRVC
jgi:hypothetical protein